MTTAKDLDMMQTYLFGKVDVLDHLISTARGPGSRALKERLMGIRDATQQHLELTTRDLLAARVREDAAADEAKNWRDRAGPSLRTSFSKPSG